MILRDRLIDLPPHRAHALEGGSGPPVVILASNLVRAGSYRPTRHAHAPRPRAIAIALPGQGAASRLKERWTLDDSARATLRVLDALHIDRPVLVGHSNSGPVVLTLALLAPHRVAQLVLVDSVGFNPTQSLPRILLGRAIDGLLEPRLTISGLHHVLLNSVLHARHFWRQVLVARSIDVRPLAPRLTVPTLVAWGRYDTTMPLSHARIAHQLIPASRLYVSPTGSHDWLITNPDEFTYILSNPA